MSEQRYSPEEVEAIIRHAMRLEDETSISREDLVAAAMEVGIDQVAIERAIEQESCGIDERRRKQAQRDKKLARFKHSASGMGIVVLMLFLIDAFSPGPWWFQWPLLVIGVTLAFRARSVYFPR